jgi:hypothetical protein
MTGHTTTPAREVVDRSPKWRNAWRSPEYIRHTSTAGIVKFMATEIVKLTESFRNEANVSAGHSHSCKRGVRRRCRF